MEAKAEPLRSTCLKQFDFASQLKAHGKTNLIFTATLYEGDRRIAWQIATFAPEKELLLPNPDLEWTLTGEGETLTITLTSRRLARFVWLRLEGAPVVFSDNYFDLPSGWTAQVNCPIPAGWTVEQARQALRVRSLADVVPGGSAFTDRLQQIWIGLKPINIAMRVVMGK